jgi:WD40 repeat protein
MSSIRFVLHVCCCIAFSQFLAMHSAYAQPAQAERRNQLSSPGLTINSKLPIARVNVMKIHGDRIYMGGQDHVVRSYLLNQDGEIDIDSCKVYRWPSWREERGNILAIAINRDGRLMTIGGVGLKNGLICEIDLATGKVVKSDFQLPTTISAIEYGTDNSIWAGSSRGEVLNWPVNESAKVVIGRVDTDTPSFVSIFPVGEKLCYAITSQGKAYEIKNQISQLLPSFTKASETILSITNTHDGRFYCIIQNLNAMSNRLVEVEIASGIQKTIWEGSFKDLLLEQIATASQNRFFAIGRKHTTGQTTDRLLMIDLADGAQIDAGEISQLDKTLAAVNVHPNKFIVGMQSQSWIELVFDKTKNVFEQTETVPVLKKIQGLRFLDAESFSWKIGTTSKYFDLRQRQLSDVPPNSATTPAESPEWCTSEFDPSVASRMRIKLQDSTKIPVSLMVETDQWATYCLPVVYKGERLLLVGHRFGVSVFRLTNDRRLLLSRKLIGHNDSVTNISFRSDKGLVLTAGLDGTICCFSLAPWLHHDELGGKFRVENGALIVSAIDPGSPIWETGLNEGEMISALYYKGSKIEPSAALGVFGNFQIGEEFQFQTARLQQGVSTRCLQRPVWKFYERDGEWIWWRWRDYYYDCSTRGENLVGWQLNETRLSSSGEPLFDRAPITIEGTKARARFYRPEKMKDLLSRSVTTPERINAPELVPPVVAMEIKEHEDHFKVTASLQVDANALLVGEPKELSVWVNDYRVSNWKQPQIGRAESCRIDKKILRSGKNRVIARAFNSIGIRGDSDSKLIQTEPKSNRTVLRSLAIGIRDYSDSRKASTGGRGLMAENLRYTVRDAQVLKRLFEKQASYFGVDAKIFIDGEATSENIFRQLELIAHECQPDDWLILSFSGHGYSWDRPSGSSLPPSFMLLTSKSSLVSESTTARTAIPIGALDEGIKFENLFNALAKIPCRKMLLIDACHSGGALDIVKALTPDLVVGPTILTASSKSQKAQEVPTVAHGVFTAAVIEALSDKFETADSSRDARISPKELYQYTLRVVPEIFKDARRHLKPDDFEKGQTPEYWSPSEDQDIPIFARVQD